MVLFNTNFKLKKIIFVLELFVINIIKVLSIHQK